MSFNDALDYQLTRTQVEREIKRHNCCIEEFYREVGYKDSFKGAEVLTWLGY